MMCHRNGAAVKLVIICSINHRIDRKEQRVGRILFALGNDSTEGASRLGTQNLLLYIRRRKQPFLISFPTATHCGFAVTSVQDQTQKKRKIDAKGNQYTHLTSLGSARFLSYIYGENGSEVCLLTYPFCKS